MNTATDRFTLDELCSLTDTSRRTVRFYIQQGVVNPPHGKKRGSYYDSGHVEQLLTVAKWQKAGLSLDAIRDILRDAADTSNLPPVKAKRPGDVSVVSRIFLGPGVELSVDPSEAGLSPEQVKALAKEAESLIQKLKEDGQ
jgi:DNA-binding transcriptional MerR regulator